MRTKSPGKIAALLMLATITLVCLVPFIDKAFYIDDPLFVWCARQIQSHPLDCYGFNVNWDGQEKPMAAVTQNPPLSAYYLALIGSLMGWSEIALHAGCLLPTLAVVFGTFYLARHFCSHPLAAALTTVTAPVFLLSGTGVMCDMMMLGFWVWSVFFWIEGLKTGSRLKQWTAAVLMAACCLTKYFGLSLILLLLIYALLERRRMGWWLACFSLPVIVLGFYQWWTQKLYGRGLLLNAVSYATHVRVGGELPSKILAGLAFTGGCIVILVLAAPSLWGRRALLAGLPALGLVGLLVFLMGKVGRFQVVEAGDVKWFFLIQISLWVVAGGVLFLLAARDWWEQRTPASALLVLWVAGTFVFACAVNWTVSGRNILPMLPAVAMLLVRRLERRESPGNPGGIERLGVPLGFSLMIGLLVAQADYRQANSARTAAWFFNRESPAKSKVLCFEGHWGFQYYMEQLGQRHWTESNPASGRTRR